MILLLLLFLMVTRLIVNNSLGFSNHDAVIIEILYRILTKKRVYCYNRGDWDALHKEVTETSRYYF